MTAARIHRFCIQLLSSPPPSPFLAGSSVDTLCTMYEHLEGCPHPTPQAWAAAWQGPELSSVPHTDFLPLSVRLQVARAELKFQPTTT